MDKKVKVIEVYYLKVYNSHRKLFSFFFHTGNLKKNLYYGEYERNG